MTRVSNSSGGGSLATQLACLEEEQHRADMKSGTAAVKDEVHTKQTHREDQRVAQEQAKQDAEKGSFWGDVGSVAKVAAVAGAVGAAAFTGGSSLVVAGALVGGGLTLGSGAARKLGASEEVVKGMEYTGAGVSLASGVGGGFAGSAAVSELSSGGALAGNAVAGGATATGGVATIEEGRAHADETNARADVRNAETKAGDAQAASDAILRRMEHEAKQSASELATASHLQQTEIATRDVALNGMRG